MKRKLAVLIAAAMFVMGAFTGCSADKKADASLNKDLSDQVTDKNGISDKEKAYQEVLDAKKAVEDAESATIDTELMISITYNEQTETNSQHFNIKRSKIDDKNIVDFVMSVKSKSEGAESATGESTAAEKTEDLPGYFYDDTLYYHQKMNETDTEETYLKEAMSYEDLMEFIGRTYFTNDINAEHVAQAALDESGGVKKYIFILDNDKMIQYMTQNLLESGVVLAEEEGVKINFANISADIDKDGFLSEYTFTVDALIKDSNGETPFKYNIATAFSKVNDTNVKAKPEKELSQYMDVKDYAQKQQEAAEAATEPQGTPLSPEEVEALGIDPDLYDVEMVTEEDDKNK